MDLSQWLPMVGFALAASISPGPVNLLCLSSGARFGVSAGLHFVTGATVGFTLLFLAVGLGLYSVLSVIPSFTLVLRWLGIIFILYLCVVLIRDQGQLSAIDGAVAPGFFTGALMQWLNPKAWMASASGIAVFAGGGDLAVTLVFASLYFVICWLSLSCWVFAGVFLSRYVKDAETMRYLNRFVALLLLASCWYLVQTL